MTWRFSTSLDLITPIFFSHFATFFRFPAILIFLAELGRVLRFVYRGKWVKTHPKHPRDTPQVASTHCVRCFADFSKFGVFAAFCGVFCAFRQTLQTANFRASQRCGPGNKGEMASEDCFFFILDPTMLE